MSIDEFIKNVKKGETPYYAWLNRLAKRCLAREAPYIPGFHKLLYNERRLRIWLWREFWRTSYYQPLFRSRCVSCGKKLHIYHSGQGLPHIEGDVSIRVGENVRIYDKTTIVGLTAGAKPRLSIGDNTDIATPVSIFIGKEVSIGANCLIAGMLIADNPGHRMHYKERLTERVEEDKIGRVIIGDYVWIAQRAMIIGDVTIGAGAIIGARAFVNKSVPPFCVAAGVPARIIKKLPFPEEMVDRVGKTQHRAYLDAVVER